MTEGSAHTVGMSLCDIYSPSNENPNHQGEPVIIIKIDATSLPILEAIMEQPLDVETYKGLHYVFPGNGVRPYILTQTAARNDIAQFEMLPVSLPLWKK